MRNCLLFILCWLGCLSAGLAQQDLPPVYVIKADSALFEIDTAHVQVLTDPQGSYTFGQVRKSGLFRVEPRYDSKRKSHVYWTRMRLRNDLSHRLNLYFCEFDSNYFDMYWLDSSNRWRHQRAGSYVPKSQLPNYNGNREYRRLLFHLAPSQETILYIRTENIALSPPVRYLSAQFQTEEGRVRELFEDVHVKDGWKDDWFQGMLIGILMLAVFYNLFTFYSTKEKVYLYFGICLFFIMLDRNSYSIRLSFFDEHPYPFAVFARFFFIIFFVFFIQAIRRFVQPDQTVTRLNRAIPVLLLITVLTYILQYASFQYPVISIREIDVLDEVMIRVVYAFCIVLSYRMMKRGVADAYFVLIAIVELFCWWLYTLVLKLLGTYAQVYVDGYEPAFFQYMEGICFAWMIIFFSAALINRYNQTRKQVAQQAIEKEQVEKEREIERNRMMASQNERLEQQVQERTTQLQQSLETLKATQNQLVQKEKLASLGELTAGIAHEIQNPLNFVNNFSEVSIELIDELNEERGKAEPNTELERELLTDLQQNLQKINQHGHRAGNIVRGMLEHSRSSTGEKQPTNMNALVDESLRLAYHGLRDKPGSTDRFNCQFITNPDPTLPTIPVVAQDISRVLINLYNNAFYAMQEKQKTSPTDYIPTLSVTTRLISPERGAFRSHPTGVGMHPNGIGTRTEVEIRIHDNGTGIPESVKQKIFQPFFTTKPTGEGTGLGLSLSYDIITKGHGGDMIVESYAGEGTTFVILLPA